MTGPRYTPLVTALPSAVPFVAPEEAERARGAPFTARLGANENVFGPSPKAIAAMQASLSEIWKYGDPTSHDLRHALADHLSIGTKNILVGEGIDGLLGYLVRLLIGPGDAVVTSAGAYPTFNYHVAGFGGELRQIPYRDDREDLPALIKCARDTGAKLIYFANPDNPMGTYTSGAQITAALDDMPTGCLLLLDEAYVEFAPSDAVPQIAADDPRVIRMRTFSKAYGMAGARVGYAIGAPDLIQSFDKIRNHFGMNRTAQIGALAALHDQDYLAQTLKKVATARTRITQIAQDNGLTALPSATNFVAVDCGRDAAYAQAILQGLGDHGVFVRMPFVAPQNRCIRISCGGAQELERLNAALTQVLADLRA